MRLRVIGTESGPTSETDASFLDGMRLAQLEINEAGGLEGRSLQLGVADDLGDPARTLSLIRQAMVDRPAAVLVVGDSAAVSEARTDIETAGVPVVVLGGDLYSGRALFRSAFQTSVPLRWQARKLARYLVADRGHQRIVVLTEPGPGGDVAQAVMSAALAEEGSAPSATGTVGAGEARRTVPSVAQGADAVVFLGSTLTAVEVSRALGRIPDPPQLALSADALQAAFAREGAARPGIVACYPYTWSGWADMLPRVQEFREAFTQASGHAPAGLEQEGYDAVRALAEALARTDGRGGAALIRILETFRDQTYSAISVRLGPDDHVLAEESQLGLFAVDHAEPPSPEASAIVSWRPIMRTFTTDGEKVNLLDRDKRVFFPNWRPMKPSPKYWRSEFGILSRPGEDPVL
ncbi:MAG: ABC transporter substrate-binding protein [Actinomycetota bacterium]